MTQIWLKKKVYIEKKKLNNFESEPILTTTINVYVSNIKAYPH